MCSLLSPPIHFSFHHQRTNINATTCKSAYEWGFPLHRYDLIEYKYLNHFYSHIFLSLFRSLHALRKCKKNALFVGISIASNGVPPSLSKRIMLAVNCKSLFLVLFQQVFDVIKWYCSCADNCGSTRGYLCIVWSESCIGMHK